MRAGRLKQRFGRPRLAARWGWSPKRVRLLLEDERTPWADPHHEQRGPEGRQPWRGTWVALPVAWWPEIAAAFQATGAEWSTEMVFLDLRWWADQVRVGRQRRRLGRDRLAARWGWGSKRVRTLLKDERRPWADPYHESHTHPASSLQGSEPAGLGARVAVPLPYAGSSDRAPLPSRMGPEEGQQRAKQGPTEGQERAGGGPARGQNFRPKLRVYGGRGASEGPTEGQNRAGGGPATGQVRASRGPRARSRHNHKTHHHSPDRDRGIPDRRTAPSEISPCLKQAQEYFLRRGHASGLD